MAMSDRERCQRYRDKDRDAYNARARATRDKEADANRTYARRHGITVEEAATRRAAIKRRAAQDVRQLSTERFEIA